MSNQTNLKSTKWWKVMFIRVGINEHNNKIEKKKVKQGTKKSG